MSKNQPVPMEIPGKSVEIIEGDGETVALVVSGAVVYPLPVADALRLVEGILREVRRINGPAWAEIERSQEDLNQAELFPGLCAGGAS